jgi:hypothetical protein
LLQKTEEIVVDSTIFFAVEIEWEIWMFGLVVTGSGSLGASMKKGCLEVSVGRVCAIASRGEYTFEIAVVCRMERFILVKVTFVVGVESSKEMNLVMFGAFYSRLVKLLR